MERLDAPFYLSMTEDKVGNKPERQGVHTVNLFSTCGCSVRFLIAMIKAKVVDSKLAKGTTHANNLPN